MTLLCATYSDGRLNASDEVLNPFPDMNLVWDTQEIEDGLVIPCFLSTSKTKLVCEVSLPSDHSQSKAWWQAHGPALILQKTADM